MDPSLGSKETRPSAAAILARTARPRGRYCVASRHAEHVPNDTATPTSEISMTSPQRDVSANWFARRPFFGQAEGHNHAWPNRRATGALAGPDSYNL